MVDANTTESVARFNSSQRANHTGHVKEINFIILTYKYNNREGSGSSTVWSALVAAKTGVVSELHRQVRKGFARLSVEAVADI